MFDLAVIGKGLSGLITAARVVKQGGKVLILPDPGLWHDPILFPLFQYLEEDIWDQFFNDLQLDLPKKEAKHEGDPAWTYLTPEMTLSFRHCTNPKELLMAHNAFLPEDFSNVMQALEKRFSADKSVLVHHIWPELIKPKQQTKSLQGLFRTRIKHILPMEVSTHKWNWHAFFHALKPLFGLPLQHHTPQFLASIYQLCAPKSQRLPLGTYTLTEKLLTYIKSKGGSVLSDVNLSEILIDHGHVRGVVCSCPHGVLFARKLLLNTSYINLEDAIPKAFANQLGFEDKQFTDIPFIFTRAHFVPVELDPKLQTFIHCPLIGVGSTLEQVGYANHFYLFEGEHPDTWFMRYPDQSQKLLNARLGLTYAHLFQEKHKPLFQPLKFHQHSETAFVNVRYAQTIQSLTHGAIGALLEGLWHAQWVYEERE